ncbi:MAG TPA: magnesium transporter [Bacillota bacterium]|nr:magnesium transporter [Bacillota bacterium]
MEELIENVNDYENEIENLILKNIDNPNLETLLEEFHFYDISLVLIKMDDEIIKTFFKTVSNDYASEIFEYLDEVEAKHIVEVIGDNLAARIIQEMDLDDAVDLLKNLEKTGMRILRQINPERRKELLQIMLYEEDEIGAYLTDSFIVLNADLSVKEAMKVVTNKAHEVDYISIIYCIDTNGVLLGYIKLKDLIIARANEILRDIIKERFPKVYPSDDKEYVAKLMQDTSESSIPVINEEGKIEGIITHDDIMDIISLAAEEDYTKFAGLGEVDIDIETITLKKSVKARLPWLMILLFLSMITSIILSLFEGSFTGSENAKILAARLAVYLPLILDMSGNTGTQSLAVMIRYLTKNQEQEKRKIKKHLYREFKTGIFQGLLMGLLVMGMIISTTYITHNEISDKNWIYAIVTSASIWLALIISTTLGAVIPFIMDRFKIDPAVASGPFITTISDIITLTVYYSISLLILLPIF